MLRVFGDRCRRRQADPRLRQRRPHLLRRRLIPYLHPAQAHSALKHRRCAEANDRIRLRRELRRLGTGPGADELDARRDLVFGLIREPFRRTLFPPPGAVGARRAEGFDLAGLARDHLIDVMRAAVSIPGLTEPALARFAADSYWRGEVHRLIDRPASLARLLEEAAAAGAEQVILVSGSPEPPGPHELSRPRLDPMGRISDHASAMDAAAVRDALRHVQHRFRAVYAIRPSYNPVGAFDLNGAYDDRSDRHHPLTELMERGYEDAYRDFIEPVVAASGEHLRAGAAEEGV